MARRSGSTLAAVDLGSNSFHLLVARAVDGHLHVLDRLRDRVALAAGLDERKRLDGPTQRRALEALERFGQRLRDIPHEAIRAVGTNTLRQAVNAPEFLARARRALGAPIEVISGLEEARLIYLGVAHSMADERGRRRRLVVDIGGGSTECIVGVRDEPRLAESLYMGCVTWTQRFFPDGVIRRGAFERAVLAARVELEPMELRFRSSGWERCIGSSGTILAIDGVLRDAGWSDRGITRRGLKRLTQFVLGARDAKRLALPGLTDERALVLPGGLAILVAVFEALEIDQMTASSGALREGLLLDLVGRIRHEDARERSVRQLNERLSVDIPHAHRVARTALELFDQVADDWGLDADARLHLGWAARLHEIGLSVAHAGFHKHGAYLAEHSDLPGFSRSGQQLVATLIRCHRRKIPIDVIVGLQGFEPALTARLCVLMRLAALLNRSRSPRAIPPVQARAAGRRLALRFPKGWLSTHALTAADLAASLPPAVWLRTPAGHLIGIERPGPAGVRHPADSRLPWTVYALPPDDPGDFPSRRRLLLALLAAVAVSTLAAAAVALRLIRKELALARLQQDFVAAVSHEFRTPLTTIRQLTESLEDGRLPSEERRQSAYRSLARAANRLHRLVEDLLDFRRMQSGAPEYRRLPIDTRDFTLQLAADFQHEFEPRGFRIHVDPGPSRTVLADPAALNRALWNLLDNAVKYSGPSRDIHLSASPSPGAIQWTVRDHGIGIPPAERPHIFEKFYRGQAARHAGIRGTGIGLAMVEQIVTFHGGNLAIDSEVGAGSAFTLSLPTEPNPCIES